MTVLAGDLLTEPHHDGSPLYVHGAVQLGATVRVRARVPHACCADAVHVRTVVDGEPVWVAATQESVDESTAWWAADLPIRNPRQTYRWLLQGDRAAYLWLNSVGVHAHDVPDRDDFRLSTSPPPPEWLADTVLYQIMPDRFARGRDSGPRPEPAWSVPAQWDAAIAGDWRDAVRQLYGGDLAGIVEHLDHLESLGVNAIYLTPFFPAPSAHRYNASTFASVDPLLGGDEALAALTAAAHARGIRVIGDLTTNHSGDEHEWFRAAVADPDAPEASFYFFDEHPHDYVGWFDVPTLPKFDLRSTELRKRLVAGPDSVVATWLRPPWALDGWRIDVANMTGRHGESDVNAEVARDIRATMAEAGGDRWLVAEHCHDASEDLRGDGWHGTMAYNWFTRPVWCWLRDPARHVRLLGFPGEPPVLDGTAVVAAMRELAGGIPWTAITASMTLLDSHDSARFRSVVADVAHQIVGVALLMTLPGVPMVFAGDEVGVEGASSDRGRRPFPWDGHWDRPLLEAYRQLIALRRESDALGRGGLRWAHVGADSLTFLRESEHETAIVHVARAPHPSVRLDAGSLGVDDTVDAAFGAAALRVTAGVVELPNDGPAVHVWRVPARGGQT